MPYLRQTERDLLIQRKLLKPRAEEPLTPIPWLTHQGRRMQAGVIVQPGEIRSTLRLQGTEKYWEPEHPAFAQYCYEAKAWEDPYGVH